jgi:hypothetical protein
MNGVKVMSFAIEMITSAESVVEMMKIVKIKVKYVTKIFINAELAVDLILIVKQMNIVNLEIKSV